MEKESERKKLIEKFLPRKQKNMDENEEEILKDKDAAILVYCRSGIRSENATKGLIKVGYTNTFDFGGIND